MYLHLGRDTVVPFESVVAVCDMDNSSWSHLTRSYLTAAEKSGSVVNVADDIPKSFVVCFENGAQTVYLSQLASSTLLRRAESMNIE